MERESGFYSPEAVSGGRVLFGYPYPPLSLLMVLPGYALGDYRYAELAAIVLSACLIAYGRPSQRSRLGAALLLTTPRVFFVLEQGWTEPAAVLLVALTAFAMMRRPRATDWTAGLMLASKQYLVIAVPLLWLRLEAAWRIARYGSRRARSARARSSPCRFSCGARVRSCRMSCSCNCGTRSGWMRSAI